MASVHNLSVTLSGNANGQAVANGGTLEITATAMANNSTGTVAIDASAFTTGAIKMTVANDGAATASTTAYTLKGGDKADTISLTMDSGASETATINPGRGNDILTIASGSAGIATIDYSGSDHGVDIVTGFQFGAGNDVIDAATNRTGKVFNNTMTEAILSVTSSTFTIGNNNILQIDTSKTFATTAAALATIEGGTLVASKEFYFAYNGTDGAAHVGFITNNATAAFNAASDTVVDLVTLVGLSAANINTANFITA